MEHLTKYETQVTDLYQYAAEQFRKYKDIISSLGLTFQKFDKLVDEITDLPKTDAKSKHDQLTNNIKAKKVVQSTYGFSIKNRKTKNKRTEVISENL